MLDKQVIMVGGKGGVGKTTCSSAIALQWAMMGQRTLLLSTDPTPSLADIFDLQRRPGERLWVRENLEILEMSHGQLMDMWDKKFGREVYEVFSAIVDIDYEEFIHFISSVLPGIAEEFLVEQIRQMASQRTFEKIIWDTAPMGQTLSLLRTPSLLKEHLRPAPRIYSRLRLGARSRRPILETISRWAEMSQRDMDFLRDEVEMILVVLPEALSVEQLGRLGSELDRYGIKISGMIINQVIKEADSPFLKVKERQQAPYIHRIMEEFPSIPVSLVPLFAEEVKGMAGVEKVRRALFV